MSIAATIIEPVEGAGGICPAPVGFLKSLSDLCRPYGILLIVDEVATGFGKTGTMFACDAEGVVPDLMTLGKGLTGGYLPVAATMATNRIFEQFLGERRRTLFHGHSFTGNQLGCAVSLASLELMPEVMEALPAKIDWLWSAAEAAREAPPRRRCPRSRGDDGHRAGIREGTRPSPTRNSRAIGSPIAPANSGSSSGPSATR